MPPPPTGPEPTLKEELRTIIARGRQVWGMVARGRRGKFILSSALMLIAAVANMSVMMWLGGLVDAMEGHQSSDTYSRIPLHLFGLADEHAWTPVSSNPAEQANVLRPPDALLSRIAIAFLSMISIVYLLREAVQVTRRCMIQNVCTQMEKETTIQLVEHLMRVDLSRLSAERIGALHGRIHRSVEGFIKFFKLAFIDFFPAIFMAGFALWGAYVKEPMVAVVMAAVIPASLFITVRQIKSQKGIRIQLLQKREGLDGTVVEQLSGIEYIRAANTLPLELQRVEAAAEDRRQSEIKHHFAMATFDSLKALNEGFFYIVVVAVSVFLAVRGEITIGSIVAFSGLYLGVMAPLREVHRILDDAHESSIRVNALLQMLSEPLDDSFNLPTMHRPRFKAGEPAIVTEGLEIAYRGADGRVKQALAGISNIVRAGETIGAAGPAGSGKSTWLKAVMRLVHPTGGMVILGGEPISTISREVIGETIGYVSQTPFVFSGTVAENIAYGLKDVSRERIEEAAKKACIHEDILAMPGGYDAQLAERGMNLSGGQRQKIALARIFLKNPPILVLDEGTSALDNISERKIQQELAAMRADRTVIMIAHRLTTLRDCDRIYVFDKGRIAESGKYEELIANDGVFAELVRSAGDAHAKTVH
jgi:ATP-binding cassette subfamily B protein